MNSAADTFFLAIDGGGTRCRVALSDGAHIWRVEVGAANVSTGFEAACAEISRGLTKLAAQADLDIERLAQVPAFLGLAGVTGPDMADRLRAALPLRQMRIADDRASALRGALGAQDGFVAHCGTGSFVASQIGEIGRFSGGWGPVLGDQASAQWVGRRALSLALDGVDGVLPQSALVQAVLSRFGSAAGIVQAGFEMSQTDFGALAPMVTAHAEQGDSVAMAILQAAADYLTSQMTAMGWRPGLPICLTGGIAPLYAGYLPGNMQTDLTAPLGDPMSGALALARAFHEEIENERC